jgi:hypothetical protein
MQETNKNRTLILLFILIAIGGIVLYGQGEAPRITEKNYESR